MKTPTKRYPLDQCALYKCPSKEKLKYYLKLKADELKQLEDAIRYNHFSVPKKNSPELREITAPEKALKMIQRRIFRLLQPIERPEWLISGERGKSYIDNGMAHINSHYLLAADIKSFYDNCRRDYVYRFFKERMKTVPDVAKLLTDIITYKGGIPTGCPTSQLIAYYAYENMFTKIAEAAKRHACIFSLYVDDMTFSSQQAFDPKKLEQEIDVVLRRYGHRLKYSKVHYYPRNKAKEITGTIVTKDHQLAVPKHLQASICKGFKALKTPVHSNTGTADQEAAYQVLCGRLLAARNIVPTIFPEIHRNLSAMKPKKK